MVSCGKKAPDAGSSKVEDVVESILLQQFEELGLNTSDTKIEMTEVVKTAVDDEAQRTTFNFRIKLRDNSSKDGVEIPGQFSAVASYTSDGDLLVEITDSPIERKQRADAQIMNNIMQSNFGY
jgi:hypothetical protein